MEEAVPLPSERKFGLFFAAVLGGFAAWSLYRGRPLLGAALLAIALGLIVATLLAPHWLRAPNRAWFKLGMALNAGALDAEDFYREDDVSFAAKMLEKIFLGENLQTAR